MASPSGRAPLRPSTRPAGLVVLDRVALDVDRKRLASEICPRGADAHTVGALGRLVEEATALGRPRAAYRLASFEHAGDGAVVVDGVTLRSRILAAHVGEVYRLFPFLATCGSELAVWAAGKDDPVERFWAAALMDRALTAATRAVGADLERRYGLERTGTLTPGSLADWPLEEQAALFRVLGEAVAAVGVRLTEGLMMDPVYSLSGVVFPTEVDFEECRFCPRERCPKRRAAFEDRLYETRYGPAAE